MANSGSPASPEASVLRAEPPAPFAPPRAAAPAPRAYPAPAAPAPRAPADTQKLRNEILRLELLVKKLQAELEAQKQYCNALEAHFKTLQESV
jgi:hypothetical protein